VVDNNVNIKYANIRALNKLFNSD